jgi:hypothetical protein
LSLLGLFAVWYRSKHRFDDEFDGNFNPDRIVNGGSSKIGDGATLPNVDFGGADTSVTPFSAFPVASVAPSVNPNMHQQGPSLVPNPTDSSSNPSVYSPYSTDYASTVDSKKRLSPQQAAMMSAVGAVGPPTNDWRTVSPGPTLSTQSSLSGTNSTSGAGTTPLISPRNAKEREALARYGPAAFGGMGLATQIEEPNVPPGQYYQQQQQQYGTVFDANGQPMQQPYRQQSNVPPGGFGTQGGFVPIQQQDLQLQAGPSRNVSGSVLVHQDAGRILTKGEEAEEDRVEEPQEEIPPTYDSIRR